VSDAWAKDIPPQDIPAALADLRRRWEETTGMPPVFQTLVLVSPEKFRFMQARGWLNADGSLTDAGREGLGDIVVECITGEAT
jgi:hypothetical protein